MKPKVTVVGSANIDFIMQAPHLPSVGETVCDCTFLQTFGGKGANQAVAAARSGGDVTFVSALGHDPFAPLMLEGFRACGIGTDWIAREEDVASGSALIMFDAQGDNYLTVAPGANACITAERVRDAEEVLAASDWIILQMEIPSEAVVEVCRLAEKHGSRVLLNYAPVRDMSVPLTPSIHALVVNENEASALSGRSFSGEDVDEGSALARDLLDRGGHRLVMLTLGRAGVLVCSGEGCRHVPAFPVQAVDTTAAGDTFCGAVTVALGEGRDVIEAARFASAAAALAVTRMGAQVSIPERGEIEAFLQRVGA